MEKMTLSFILENQLWNRHSVINSSLKCKLVWVLFLSSLHLLINISPCLRVVLSRDFPPHKMPCFLLSTVTCLEGNGLLSAGFILLQCCIQVLSALTTSDAMNVQSCNRPWLEITADACSNFFFCKIFPSPNLSSFFVTQQYRFFFLGVLVNLSHRHSIYKNLTNT